MGYGITVFILFILLTLVWRHNRKKQEQKKLDKLRNQWGKVKDEYFNFELTEKYSEVNGESSFHELAAQTINDIDFHDLFCFIDRTTSNIGQQYLFDKLKKPTNDIGYLKQLNEQAQFFSDNAESRERVQKQLILLSDRNSHDIPRLLQPDILVKNKSFTLFIVDSLFVVFLILLLPFYHPALLWLMLLFAVNMFLHYRNKNNTYKFISSFPQLNILINVASTLSGYTIPFEKNEALESIDHLKAFQKKFRFLNYGQSVGDEAMQAFMALLEVVKGLFLIELITFNSLIRLLDQKQKHVLSLFQFVGSIDAAISIASLRAGEGKMCEPLFIDEEKEMRVKDVYHPLIPGCVTNSIDIDGKSVLITGSNMSGKTTFLRTIAVNSVLAQTIYTCFASSYEAPVLKLLSSIRIDDNLLEGKSYYLAEVDTMASLIAQVSSPYPNLFLLDEVFKGTNTIERIASAKAILSYLNKNNNIVIVSTHDLELSALLNKEYELYHFEETIINDQLTFDHLLKPGPLKTRNAIKILELSNYPAEIISEATALSKTLTADGAVEFEV